MTEQKQTFDRLLTSIENQDRISKRNAVLWTTIPIVAAFALLGYSSWRLATSSNAVSALEQTAEDAKREIYNLTVQIDEKRAEVSSLRQQLEQTEKTLRETLEFSKYRFVVDPVDVKDIYSRFPREAKILDFIIDMREQDVGWRLGGRSPEEGFDSPSFAEYVLRRFDLSDDAGTAGLPLIAASRRLYNILPRADSPRIGDLAFYPSGYVMFYFLGSGNEPFVIGMTPFGIAAFKEDFAKVIGYRRPGNQ